MIDGTLGRADGKNRRQKSFIPVYALSEKCCDEGHVDLDEGTTKTRTELAVIAVPYAGGQVSRLPD